MTTPSHWILDLNVSVDTATREPPEVVLAWVLMRPYSFIPPVPYHDQCQLSPTALSDWLQDRASIPARATYEPRWGVNFMSGGGLPLGWFDHDQQRHITAHRMDNVPTMTVLAHRSSHRDRVSGGTPRGGGGADRAYAYAMAWSHHPGRVPPSGVGRRSCTRPSIT